MAEKSRQHILPRVYQRPFADASPPTDWPADRPFEPRIWKIPRDLSQDSRGKSPDNAFVATHYYTLRDDDPSDPRIERALGELESAYGSLLPRLAVQEELEIGDYLRLVLFVGALRARTPRQVDHWQEQFEEMERMYRMVERAHTGAERAADAEFWMGSEMSKRFILAHAESWAKVAGPSSWLLVNDTSAPFLSSDNPATHTFLHRDELEGLGFAASVLAPGSMRSHQAFFSYCPLTPKLALISSPLLVPPDNSIYRSTSDLKHILLLNEYMRHCAEDHLIAPVQDPYGPVKPLLRSMDEARRKLMESSPGVGVILYTNDDRFELSCEETAHDPGPHPLQSRIRFRTKDIARLRHLAVGTAITELTVYERFRPMGGMRQARVVSVAATVDDFTVIEQDLRTAI